MGIPVLTRMKSEIVWLNDHVSPFMLTALLCSSADLNWVTAYVFVASFLVWITLVVLYIGLRVYDRGIMRWVYGYAEMYTFHVIQRLKELKHLYLMKTACGVLLVYLVASCVLWVIHFDFLDFIHNTLDFIKQLPVLLADTHQLILAIQNWLNRVLLWSLVNYMHIVWEWQKELISSSPWLGALSISATLIMVTALLEVGCWMRGLSLMNVARAVRSFLN